MLALLGMSVMLRPVSYEAVFGVGVFLVIGCDATLHLQRLLILKSYFQSFQMLP